MLHNLFFDGAKKLWCSYLGTVSSGQDGAIYKDLLFRFDARCRCKVHNLQNLQEVASFTLDKAEQLMPHSNAVFFGRDFYEPEDEFPVLYTNIYNNYSRSSDRMEGVLCAYRIQRTQDGFSSQLLQVLRVGFAHDSQLWCSEGNADIRPYGNFVMDTDTNALYAFVMRDKTHSTRFFRFDMPPVTAGELDETLGVPVKTFLKSDIAQQFDECYVNFMQGAICHKGIIYSVEGFDYPNETGNPALRIFDTSEEKQVFFADLVSYGLEHEPEFIEVYQDTLYYSDNTGGLYVFGFEN